METSHQTHFMAGLKRALDEGSHSDLTVTVGDASFPCHRIIVKSMSPYIKERLSAGDVEMALEDVDVDAFKDTLNFMYTGVLPQLREDNIAALLNTAKLLQMDDLQLAIEEEFGHRDIIGAHNYLSLQALAIKHNSSFIQNEVYKFILFHFEYIWKKGELNAMSFNQLHHFALRNDLILSSEFVLLKALVDWILAQNQLSWDETKLLISVPVMPLITEENIHEIRCMDQMEANQRLSSLLLDTWERDHTTDPDGATEAPIPTYKDYL
ncbi:kelch repeat and BTB domain-containing protein 12-like isoform X2 [Haliotis rubra]|nr:kelch repeat and BTB domain-containing protein 12-like isoform X2 [Haliotis rubra]